MLTTPESAGSIDESPHEPAWLESGINVWTAEADGVALGSIEQTPAYGYVVKNSRGEWIASFSTLGDAMWFLEIAARTSRAA